MPLGLGDNRLIQQAPQPRLEEAVEVRVPQHHRAPLPPDIKVILQHNSVRRQRPRLIGAQHIESAEVLDRAELLHDDLTAGQHQRPSGKIRGDDHRQHFWRQADGHTDAKVEGLIPVPLGEAVDHEDDRNEDGHEPDEQPRDLLDPLIEARLRPLAEGVLGQGCEVGVRARGRHQQRSAAAHHCGPHEAHILQLQSVGHRVGGRLRALGGARGQGRGGLLGGQGLPGERGLVHVQVP
mmetsp:Transcript_81444/g.136308  ORF Transcript_81444/g.136308 Transcript_81444/m.136308 type:complete len:237 (+) Transcript_81444:1999-2709(+)